jgi:tRNA threonylcarbamoyladenosine biosynthesis protein TsaE
VPLYHFDFYRLESEEETLGIGLEDYLSGDGVVAIEWADKFPRLLPPAARWFRFSTQPGESRQISESACPP